MEAFGRISIGEESHDLTPDNTVVYQHFGRLAIYDHLFISLDEERYVYFWNHYPHYAKLLEGALGCGATAHLNLRAVAEVDERNYMLNALKDLNTSDTVPDEWLHDGTEA